MFRESSNYGKESWEMVHAYEERSGKGKFVRKSRRRMENIRRKNRQGRLA